MNTMYAPAFAAFGGSAFGAISTIVTGWVTRRRRLRERHYARSISKRERLYRSFIEEASRVYADALVSDKSEIPQLVNLYALIGRMRILSSDQVVQAAERAGRLIIETYLSPNREFVDLPEFHGGNGSLAWLRGSLPTRIAFDPISLRSQAMQERIPQAGSPCIRRADRTSSDPIAPPNRVQEDYRRRYRSRSVDVARQRLPLLRFKAGDRRGGRGGFVRTRLRGRNACGSRAARLWSV